MAPAYVTKTTQLPIARCPFINYLQSPNANKCENQVQTARRFYHHERLSTNGDVSSYDKT